MAKVHVLPINADPISLMVPSPPTATITSAPFNIAVLVAALGYFVDIYDLLLFSIIRVPSLKSLGLSEELSSLDG